MLAEASVVRHLQPERSQLFDDVVDTLQIEHSATAAKSCEIPSKAQLGPGVSDLRETSHEDIQQSVTDTEVKAEAVPSLDTLNEPSTANRGFDAKSMTCLKKSFYLATAIELPQNDLLRWDSSVRQSLGRDVHALVKAKYAASGDVHFRESFGMVGTRKKQQLIDIKPTILVWCSGKEARKHIKKELKAMRMHYLEDFGHDVMVLHEVLPELSKSKSKSKSWSWSVSEPEGGSAEEQGPALGELRAIWVEQPDKSFGCGPKLKWDVFIGQTTVETYATLGGFVQIEESLWALSAAHPFLKSELAADSGNLTEPLSDLDSNSDSESSGTSSDQDNTIGRNRYAPSEGAIFNALWHSGKTSGLVYSFLGTVRRPDSRMSNEDTPSDWVLIKIPDEVDTPDTQSLFSFADSGYESLPGASVIAEHKMDLCLGPVCLTAEPGRIFYGFMTEASVSLHSGDSMIAVREIMVDSPLPPASSGCWVFRGSKAVGMIVAATPGGRSCFILTMQDIARNIEQIFNRKVQLVPLADVSQIPRDETLEKQMGLITVDGRTTMEIREETEDIDDITHEEPGAYVPGLNVPSPQKDTLTISNRPLLQSIIQETHAILEAKGLRRIARNQPAATYDPVYDSFKVSMIIRGQDDSEGTNPIALRDGIIDTGGSMNLVTENFLRNLGLKYEQSSLHLVCVNGSEITLPGTIQLSWSDALHPRTTYKTKFGVLPYNPSPAADFWLGCNWIKEAMENGRFYFSARSKSGL